MNKKKCNIFILIVLSMVIFTLYAKSRSHDVKNKIYGKWKVTEYFCHESRLVPSYSIYEHFLGRSIEIAENKIIKSIGYWPDEINYVIKDYQYMKQEIENAYLFGVNNFLKNIWHEKYDGQRVEVYNFYESLDAEYLIDTYVITEDGSVLCKYLQAYFYMEPYVSADLDLEPEQLYGSWMVERLVSYQDGWRGNNAVLPEARRFESDTVYLDEEGAEFYPLDYYGTAVDIDNNFVIMQMEDGTKEQYTVRKYKSELLNTEDYETNKGIHDELGILNDCIEVVKAEITNPSEEMLWDGEIVVVNETHIIMKLYQGWFELVKIE